LSYLVRLSIDDQIEIVRRFAAQHYSAEIEVKRTDRETRMLVKMTKPYPWCIGYVVTNGPFLDTKPYVGRLPFKHGGNAKTLTTLRLVVEHQSARWEAGGEAVPEQPLAPLTRRSPRKGLYG